MHPLIPGRDDNDRRRRLACQVLLSAILGDGIEPDTFVLGVTVTTVNPAGEYVQHSCGLRDGGVRRMLVPVTLRGELDALVDKLVDLSDLPDVPGSPGMLP